MGGSWASRRSAVRLARSFLDITLTASIIVWHNEYVVNHNSHSVSLICSFPDPVAERAMEELGAGRHRYDALL